MNPVYLAVQQEARSLRYLYYGAATASFAILLFLLFAIHLHPFYGTVAVCGMRLALQYLESLILRKRTFNEVAVYCSRWSVWDYIALALIISTLVYTSQISNNSVRYFPYGAIIPIIASIRSPWHYSPKFVLTEDKLIQNNINVLERKLADLHSIELMTLPHGFEISFVDTYSVKIPRGGLSETAICDFVNSLIEQAPVEPDIQPEALEFLNKHCSHPVKVSS